MVRLPAVVAELLTSPPFSFGGIKLDMREVRRIGTRYRLRGRMLGSL